jgi:glutamate 5-kinase
MNLSNTLESLFGNNILPIINENDALAVEEIKVGDNDTLASLIVPMINADILVLVSDIDGLYDKNPKIYKDARKIDVVTSIDSSIDEMVGEITSNVGTGGMATKIKAARITTKAGCNMAIISATCVEKIVDLIKGEKIGTLFVGDNKALHSKEHWMVFNAYAKGSIIVDNGASSAILKRKSLLASGITKVEGNFKENNVIFIVDESGKKLAKGISNFSSEDIKQVIGKHSQDVKDILKSTKDEIVHASMMVLIEGDEYGTIK